MANLIPQTRSHEHYIRPQSSFSASRAGRQVHKTEPSAPSFDTMSRQADMSPIATRRGIRPNADTTFQDQHSSWEADDPYQAHPHSIYDASDHTYMHSEASYVEREQQNRWSYDFSGSCTPTTAFESLPTQIGHSDQPHYSLGTAASHHAQAYCHSSINYIGNSSDVTFTPAPSSTGSMPLSPQLHPDYMMSMEEDARSMERQRPLETPRHSATGFLKGDGVRKKNARLDIPPDRGLDNIDNMITAAQQAGDETKVKELRTQKRLLRNREAALQSRQRKKQHTENLEEKQRQYDQRLEDVQMRLNSFERERHALDSRHHNDQQVIQQLRFENEQLMEKHTIETSNLRSRIALLQENTQNHNTPLLTVPSSTCFTEFNNSLNGMDIEGNEWDTFDMLEDFALEPEAVLPIKPSEILPDQQCGKHNAVEGENPVASGLLLMLLLYGAFVASNASGSMSSTLVPRVPEDLQAASATVLDNVFREAGISTASLTSPQAQSLTNGRPAAVWGSQMNSWSQCRSKSSEKPRHKFSDIASESPTVFNRMGKLHQTLTRPTKAQEMDQAFSLSAEQYNRITTHDSPTSVEHDLIKKDGSGDFAMTGDAKINSGPCRTLATALAAMKMDNKGSTAADVYTRSLLCDEIKPEVVLEFKRIVEESNRLRRENNDIPNTR